jgi:hypothetical protein
MTLFTKKPKRCFEKNQDEVTLVPNSLGSYEFRFGQKIYGTIKIQPKKAALLGSLNMCPHYLTDLLLSDGRIIKVVMCSVLDNTCLTEGAKIQANVGFPTERCGDNYCMLEGENLFRAGPEERVSLIGVKLVPEEGLYFKDCAALPPAISSPSTPLPFVPTSTGWSWVRSLLRGGRPRHAL